MRDIKESDRKLLRQLKPVALDRYCERVLSEVGRAAAEPGASAHARYLNVFNLIQRRNRELADAFDDVRRSTALLRLACIRSHGLLTDEELARFSADTREALRSFDAIRSV